ALRMAFSVHTPLADESCSMRLAASRHDAGADGCGGPSVEPPRRLRFNKSSSSVAVFMRLSEAHDHSVETSCDPVADRSRFMRSPLSRRAAGAGGAGSNFGRAAAPAMFQQVQ